MDTVLRWLMLAAAIQQIVLPAFINPFAANAGPSAIDRSVDSGLEPAGYAFSIWGPIYLLALAFAVWSLLPASRSIPAVADTVTRIAPQAIAVYLGSTLWLLMASHGPLWATMPILVAMAGATAVALIIAVRAPVAGTLSTAMLVVPFALYAGWTLCASFVNIAEVAPAYGFARFGLGVEDFAVAALIGAVMLAVLLLLSVRLSPWALAGLGGTVVWALVAIIVATLSREGGSNAIMVTAALGATAVGCLAAGLIALRLRA